jgi:hypothetical protein
MTYYIVRRGLDGKTRESVALGIYRALQEQVEYEEKPPWGLGFQSWSYYSLEDLTSDEIGFYLALTYGGKTDPTKDDGKNGDAWRYLARVCGFPEDREEARKWSLDVYESYGMSTFEWYFTKTPRVFTWGSPLLCNTDVANSECADKAKRWPSEFTSVIPTAAQRDGLWWMYDKKQDGKLLPTNYTGFYFLTQ